MKVTTIKTASAQKKGRFILCVVTVFVLAFVLRIAFAFFALKNNAVLYPDSYDYIRLADSICQNFSYGLNSQEIFRVPVYPVFLAIIKSISPSYFLPVSILAQSILDSLTAVIIVLITLRMFNLLAFAVIAGFFYAVSPLAIASSAQILCETLFAFLLVVLLLLLTKLSKDKLSLLYCLIIGLLMAVLTLTRAVFLPISMLFFLFILIRTKRFKAFLLTGLTCYIILCGWGLRNYLVAGYFGISSVSDILIYRYNACALEAEISGKSFVQVQTEFDSKLSLLKTQQDQALFASNEGWHIILEDPFKYAFIHLRTSLNSLLPASGDLTKAFGLKLGDKGTLSIINSKGLLVGVKYYFAGNMGLFFILLPLGILLCIQYILSIIGAMKALKIRDERFLFVLLLILCVIYFVFIGGPASTPRFRLPAEGIIFVFASYGLYMVFGFFARRKNAK